MKAARGWTRTEARLDRSNSPRSEAKERDKQSGLGGGRDEAGDAPQDEKQPRRRPEKQKPESLPQAQHPGARPRQPSHDTGNSAAPRNGTAIPSPRHMNTARISSGPRARAKPTAVPTKGAEQGVASRARRRRPERLRQGRRGTSRRSGAQKPAAGRSGATRRSSLRTARSAPPFRPGTRVAGTGCPRRSSPRTA